MSYENGEVFLSQKAKYYMGQLPKLTYRCGLGWKQEPAYTSLHKLYEETYWKSFGTLTSIGAMVHQSMREHQITEFA